MTQQPFVKFCEVKRVSCGARLIGTFDFDLGIAFEVAFDRRAFRQREAERVLAALSGS
jgi:hypothetical protein